MAKRSKRRAQPAMAGPTDKPVPTPGAQSSKGTATPSDPKAPPTQVADKPRRRRSITGAGDVKFTWPFGRRNLMLFLAALVVIVLGYVFLAQGPYDSFMSVTLGPVLLVIGYLVVLPAAILVKDKPASESAPSRS